MMDYIPFGSQYYRYPTPLKADWDQDLANMKKAGFDTIKFMLLWRANNRKEGVFDFSDGRELLDLCEKHGLKAVINPILGSVPGWVYNKYPDCFMVTGAGRVMRSQACPCYHHKPIQQLRRDTLHAMARELGNHPALLCWDVWNEPELSMFGLVREPIRDNLLCYCDTCRAEFIQWVKRKYGTIEALEDAWHAAYADFDDICLPRYEMNYKTMIDFRNFFADTLEAELHLRAQAVRDIDKVHPVMCHTVPRPYFNFITTASDEYRLQKECDLFGNSLGSDPFAAAVNTSAARGKTVINSEIHAIGGTTVERPTLPTFDHFKRHIFTPLSRGIKGFLFWQYRAERIGYEAPAWGMTKPDGSPEYWLDYASQLARAVKKGGKVLRDAMPKPARIAILSSNETDTFLWHCSEKVELYDKSLRGAFRGFYDRNYNCDVISYDRFMDGDADYDMIYMPIPYYMRRDVADKLKAFVENGGTLASECFFGGYQDEDGFHSTRMPGYGFEEVFGCQEKRVEMDENPALSDTAAVGSRFREELTPTTAKVLHTFENGSAAVTVNHFGKGRAIMAGTLLGYNGNNGDLLAEFARIAGVQPNAQSSLRIDSLYLNDAPVYLFAQNNIGGRNVKLDPAFAGKWENVLTGEVLEVSPDGETAIELADNGCEMYARR